MENMSMYNTTRYENKYVKKKVVNIVVPTHLTDVEVKLPETLRLDKTTDVYLDQVTDMAGQTSECFPAPANDSVGAHISVKRNYRNFGMEGNKEDNSQLMVIKIDELEIKNISAMGNVIEKEDIEAMNYYNRYGAPVYTLDNAGDVTINEETYSVASGTPPARPITDPNQLPKWWAKNQNRTSSPGVNDLYRQYTDEDMVTTKNYLKNKTKEMLDAYYGMTIWCKVIKQDTLTRKYSVGILGATGIESGDDPFIAASQPNHSDSNTIGDSVQMFSRALNVLVAEVYPDAFNGAYQPGGFFQIPPEDKARFSRNLQYNSTALGFNGDGLGGAGDRPPKTASCEFTRRFGPFNKNQMQEFYRKMDEAYNHYSNFIDAKKEWHGRVQRYEYSQNASNTLNNSILVPNSKNTKISDEYIQNASISNNGDPAGIKNGILTDYQEHLVDNQVKTVDTGNVEYDNRGSYVFKPTEYTIEKEQGMSSSILRKDSDEALLNPQVNFENTPWAHRRGGGFVKGYERKGVHTHRLNKFNYISTIQPKTIDSFHLNYGFFKSRILGLSRGDDSRSKLWFDFYGDNDEDNETFEHFQRQVDLPNIEDLFDRDDFDNNYGFGGANSAAPNGEEFHPYFREVDSGDQLQNPGQVQDAGQGPCPLNTWESETNANGDEINQLPSHFNVGEIENPAAEININTHHPAIQMLCRERTYTVTDDPPIQDWIGWNGKQGRRSDQYRINVRAGPPLESTGPPGDEYIKFNYFDGLRDFDLNEASETAGATIKRISQRPNGIYQFKNDSGAPYHQARSDEETYPTAIDNSEASGWAPGSDWPSTFDLKNKPSETYSKEKYPGWEKYRGGILRPLSYDNPSNKYDDARDHNLPNVNDDKYFGIAAPDMKYSPDVGNLCITLVFIERDD